MGLIKKPAEITAKRTASILIYGQPSMGKTTLACSAEKPVLFDFDGGVGRIHAEHRVDTLQVTNWGEIAEALAEVRQAGCYSTIVIDTIGKMLDCIVDYIKVTQPSMVQRDGTLSLKGYGVRKNIWKQFLCDVSNMGMSVLFIGHEKEEKQGDMVVKRADAGNATTANELFKDLDLIGYLSANGKNRSLDFCGSDIIYAKAPTSMRKAYEVDTIINAQGMCIGKNDYFERVVMNAYNTFLSNNDAVVTEYNALLDEIRRQADAIETPEDADMFAKYIKNEHHIFDSQLQAREMMRKRIAELGIVFDKESGHFVSEKPAKQPADKKTKKSNKNSESDEA